MALLERFRRAPEAVAVEQAKALIGPGAAAIAYGEPIDSRYGAISGTPRGMARAQALSWTQPWMNKAERLVSGRAAALGWHLEDADDETIDDESAPQLQEVMRLLERPSPITNPAMTWRQLAKITYRHMGVINVGAWYLDRLNGFGIPTEILYLNPCRLTPGEDRTGLTHWRLDAEASRDGTGTRLELDEVILFILEPPDVGYFGTGLVAAADGKASLSRAADRFTTQTYSTGGRRGSFIGPREGRLPDDVYDALVANLRNVRESPDATKRDIVTKAPLDITPQASTPQELQAADVMRMTREDILLIWGIDIADAGIPGGAGLSSGQLREQARQSTYENAVGPRVDVFAETVQLQLIDRWKEAGIALEFVIEQPEFEDDTPAYERAAKVIQLPLRNVERRAILGLDPFGDPVLDNAVWLPAGMGEVYVAPDEATGKIPEAAMVVEATEPLLSPSGELADEAVTRPEATKGLHGLRSGQRPVKAAILGHTRSVMERRQTPAMQRSVAKVLADQRAEIVRLVREKAAHLLSKPGDVRAVWNAAKWDKALTAALRPHETAVAETVAAETKKAIGHLKPSKADPFIESVQDSVWKRGAERVTGINGTTRDAVMEAIRRVIAGAADEGLPVPEVADRLTDAVGTLTAWDPERAELVARTELMFAYNDAALASFGEYGVDRVEAIDGDEDAECAERNGQTFTLDEARDIADHPNGTLDWLPVI